MQSAPENLMEYIRQKQAYELHRQKLRTMNSTIEVDNAPAEATMKHLLSKAKKQQLIEDRHQEIANDNRKLMEKMSQIMAEKRTQLKPIKAVNSLNERERRKFAERINKENQAMLNRLKGTTATLDSKHLGAEYENHKKLVKSLAKKRFNPMIVKPSSPKALDWKTGHNDSWVASTFDAETYLSQHMGGSFIDLQSNSNDSPIQGIAELRQEIISKKKASQSQPNSKPSSSSQIRFENLPGVSLSAGSSRVKYELKHEPVV